MIHCVISFTQTNVITMQSPLWGVLQLQMLELGGHSADKTESLFDTLCFSGEPCCHRGGSRTYFHCDWTLPRGCGNEQQSLVLCLGRPRTRWVLVFMCV